MFVAGASQPAFNGPQYFSFCELVKDILSYVVAVIAGISFSIKTLATCMCMYMLTYALIFPPFFF